MGRLPPALKSQARIGFAYDDPRVTPPARIRHDCTVIVDGEASLSEDLEGDGFELLESPAGLWAVVEVEAADISQAYRTIFDGWFQQRHDYAIEGDPFLERWTATPDGPRVTVCVRIRQIADVGTWNMAAQPAF